MHKKINNGLQRKPLGTYAQSPYRISYDRYGEKTAKTEAMYNKSTNCFVMTEE